MNTMKRVACICAGVLVCSPLITGVQTVNHAMTAYADDSSGTIGENLTWTLTDSGELTISGTGEWQDGEMIPEEILRSTDVVIIQDGVTSIGKNAFGNSIDGYYISSVSIPDTVTSIGERAFEGCTLGTLTIPASVRTIGDIAFCGCRNLTNVTLPASVESIGKYAFCGCENLKYFTILNPECDIFDNEVTVSNEDEYCPCEDLRYRGIIRGYENSTAQAYAEKYGYTFKALDASEQSGTIGDNLTWTLIDSGELTISGTGEWQDGKMIPEEILRSTDVVIIQDGVTSIGERAFEGCTLGTLTIPASVRTIGDIAFCGCRNLTNVTLPASVESIGKYAFCGCENLKYFTILNPECDIFDNEVTVSNEDEYCPCEDLRYRGIIRGYADSTAQKYAEKYGYTFKEIGGDITWNLSDDGVLTVSGSGVLADIFPDDVKEKTKSVVIESGVTAIRNAIYCFTNLESLKIPDTVTELDNAFFECESLREIEIPESVTEIRGNAFYGTAWLEEKQKENPLVIVNHILIDGSTASGDIVIPEGTVSINDSAFFYNDGKMTSVSIHASVKSIGDSAFSGCSGLTSVEIPEGVESIGNSAFWYCENLTSVSLPASLTSIGELVFWCDKNLTDLSLSEENPNYCVEDGVLFTKDKTELICYPAAKTAGTYSVPDSVTCICTTAFSDNQNLTDITLPSGLKSIDNSAFSKCAKLESIVIPESVDSIGNGVFQMCSNLKTVTLPNNLTEIPGGMFSGSGLTEITLPEALESIGANAFSDCDALKEIRIPETVTSIEREAFIGCDGLTAFLVSENNGTYASLDGVLYSIYQTELITYPSGKTDKEFTVPDSVATIDFMAFRSNPYLEKVMILESVTVLESDAFYMCDSLKEVTIMNPDCTIKNRLNTNYPSRLCVRGYADSTAQKYAEKYGYTFIAINEKAAPAPDLDGDGKISATDAQMILNAFSAIMNDDEPDLTPEQLKAADVDGDGKVSALDAQYVLSYFLTTVVLDEPITWEEIIG